jgi:hypothetical protein
MRSLIPRLSIAVTVAALTVPVVATAAPPFSFRVPDRSGNVPPNPVALVKFTLETAGLAGQTLKINGNNVALPTAGFVALGGGADLVRADVTGNDVTVQVDVASLYGSLANADDRCTAKSGAIFPVNYGVDFSGTINGYRLTSYSALSQFQCTCAKRRLKNSPVTWSPAPSAGATDKGRHPLDLALVLDKSGSMNDPTPGDVAMKSKWFTLDWAVRQFGAIWRAEGLGAAQTGGTELSKDRLGMVFFDSSVDEVKLNGQFWTERGSLAADDPTHPWTQLIAALASRGPGSATSLGGGLKAAINERLASPVNDAAIVLMTDGLQNALPCVNDDGAHKTLGLGASPGVMPCGKFSVGDIALKDECIPVLGVAVGPAAGSTLGTPGELLESISQQTAGKSRLTVGSSTDFAFAGALVDALKGNTLSIESQLAATLGASVAAAPPVTAGLDGSVKQAIVVLGWLGDQSNALTLNIKNPAGGSVKPTVLINDPFFTVQRVDIPLSGAPGDWQLDVARRIGGEFLAARTNTIPRDLPYHLAVYVVEKKLDFELSFKAQKHHTGDPIDLLVNLSLDSKGLASLGNDLKIEVDRPATGLGNALRTLAIETPKIVPNMTSGQNDQYSSYDLKVGTLLADPTQFGALKSQPTQQLKPSDDGNGHYSLKFTDTTVPGLYRFRVTLDTAGPDGGRIKRTETIDAAVKVMPDAQKSEIKSQQGTEAGTYLVTMVPQDKFGNFQGPGYESQLIVMVAGATFLGASDPSVNGTYLFKFGGVTAPDNTKVVISYDGTPFVQGSLPNLLQTTIPIHCLCRSTAQAAHHYPGELLFWSSLLLMVAGMSVRRRLRRPD